MLRGAFMPWLFSHVYHANHDVRTFSSTSFSKHRDDFTISTHQNGDIACNYKHEDPSEGIKHLKKLQDSIEPGTFESEMVAQEGKVALIFSAKRNHQHPHMMNFVHHVVGALPRSQAKWPKKS